MSETELMQQEIDRLRTQVKALKSRNQLSQNYYYSDAAQKNWLDITHIPQQGMRIPIPSIFPDPPVGFTSSITN